MTYNAEVQFKFDATWTPSYSSSFSDDDFIPEEHYLITAPAADLNAKQYFKLFEKFMLCVGMTPQSIRSGAMSLVFNDYVSEEEQRKVCKEYELTMDEDLEDKFKEYKIREEEWERLKVYKEYELTMDEDLEDKFKEYKIREEEWERLKKGPMGTVLNEEELTNLEEGQ